MSIDFKDIFRYKNFRSNCVHKKPFLDFLSGETLHSVGAFFSSSSLVRSFRFFFFSPQYTLGRSERVSGSLLCMFLFIFKAFWIFFNNIFCVWQKGKEKKQAREKIDVQWGTDLRHSEKNETASSCRVGLLILCYGDEAPREKSFTSDAEARCMHPDRLSFVSCYPLMSSSAFPPLPITSHYWKQSK